MKEVKPKAEEVVKDDDDNYFSPKKAKLDDENAEFSGILFV